MRYRRTMLRLRPPRLDHAGFSLLQSLIAVALLGGLIVGGLQLTSSSSKNAKLVAARANALGPIEALEAFLEVRLANFFRAAGTPCNSFRQSMANSFAASVIEADNLLVELATPANLAPIPATIRNGDAKNKMQAAWTQCSQDLPNTAPAGVLKFCIRLAKADTSMPAQHIASADPTFAVVEARLVNLINNSTVNCADFVEATIPARAFQFNYQLYWITTVDSGSGALAMRHGGFLYGSPRRGFPP
jgi:hypothetical protein